MSIVRLVFILFCRRILSTTTLDAFAYISPDDYEIGPMPDIPEKTLTDFAALKERSPNVVLGVSLCGWTFNDNHTDTQIVFADLSSTPEKRSKFIKNPLSFMRHYGFNAVDLDWEYPGAPDRQPEDWDGADDGKNYVKLMQDIRKAFEDIPGEITSLCMLI